MKFTVNDDEPQRHNNNRDSQLRLEYETFLVNINAAAKIGETFGRVCREKWKSLEMCYTCVKCARLNRKFIKISHFIECSHRLFYDVHPLETEHPVNKRANRLTASNVKQLRYNGFLKWLTQYFVFQLKTGREGWAKQIWRHIVNGKGGEMWREKKRLNKRNRKRDKWEKDKEWEKWEIKRML